MGRSGGGGGGHSSSGHGSSSHHGSSHHSSGGSGGFRSGGSSFHSGPSRSGGSGFGGGPSRSGGPGFGGPGGGPGFGGPSGPRRPSPPPPPPRHYGAPPPPPRRRGSSGNGCATLILVAIILIIYAFMALFRSASGANITDNNLSEYAEDQYTSIFNGREDGLLIVLDENDDGQIKYGAKANAIMDAYVDDMWNNYDKNYNDDLGIQLGNMFTDTANEILDDNVTPITPDKSFDSHCYRDEINWVDTKSNLQTGAEYFYEATGIQAYVLLVKAKTIAKATNKSAGVLKVLIIVCGAVIIVCIGYKWWKKRIAQKNKEQEDLERTLKTPLETFGTTGTVEDLEKKYDDTNTTNTSQ